MDEQELRIRKRLKEDFPHYAAKCLRIRPKGLVKGKDLPPLILNEAQRYIHAALEAQREATGRVRALILKGRQQGASTYIQGRMLWRISHTRGMRGYIMAHKDDSTSNMFKMAKTYYDNLPEIVKPSKQTSNAQELEFNKLSSGYKISTAGGRDSGRSETIQFLHLSEAAYFKDAETILAAVLEAVPDEEGTEVFIESTSAGPQGRFYEMCMAAHRGESDYQLIFTPWFLSKEYRKQPPKDFVRTDEEQEYAEAHGLDDAQLYWRRMKIQTLKSLTKFRQEYPATPEEAFRGDVEGALWKQEILDRFRVGTKDLPTLTRIVVAVDPSGGDKERNDGQGIVAAALGSNGHGYVLRDRSMKASPQTWATATVDLFDELQADRVVWEANFGGQMVEHTLKTVRSSLPTKKVVASRGKAIRAEPVVALYEQGMVHHVGPFYMLEDELVTWDPTKNMKSPNRLDALVWCITELMLDQTGGFWRKQMEM